MKLSERAGAFAALAHDLNAKKPENRFCKYTGEPYIVHPAEVVSILKEYFAVVPEEVLAAAFLHDVLEDTTVPEEELRAEFGNEVAKLVLEVTDVSKPEDGNRAKRKAMDRDDLLAKASYWGTNIKLADVTANGASIAKHDPKFANVFRGEKNELLCVLLNGDDRLWVRALHSMMEE